MSAYLKVIISNILYIEKVLYNKKKFFLIGHEYNREKDIFYIYNRNYIHTWLYTFICDINNSYYSNIYNNAFYFNYVSKRSSPPVPPFFPITIWLRGYMIIPAAKESHNQSFKISFCCSRTMKKREISPWLHYIDNRTAVQSTIFFSLSSFVSFFSGNLLSPLVYLRIAFLSSFHLPSTLLNSSHFLEIENHIRLDAACIPFSFSFPFFLTNGRCTYNSGEAVP